MSANEWTNEELLQPFISVNGGNCENGDYHEFARFNQERVALIESFSHQQAHNKLELALARLTSGERAEVEAHPATTSPEERDPVRLAKLLKRKVGSFQGVSWDEKGVMSYRV